MRHLEVVEERRRLEDIGVFANVAALMAGRPIRDGVDLEVRRKNRLQLDKFVGRDALGNDMVDLELTVRNRNSAVETLLFVGSPDRNFLGLTESVITHGCSESRVN